MNEKTIKVFKSDCCNAPVQYFGNNELFCTKCGFICDIKKHESKSLLADLHQIFYDKTKIEISLEIDSAIRRIRDAVLESTITKKEVCSKCGGTGLLGSPDMGSSWRTYCDCQLLKNNKEEKPKEIILLKKEQTYSIIRKFNEISKAINWLLKNE